MLRNAATWMLAITCSACAAASGENAPALDVQAGGDTSVTSRSSNAYTFPAPNLGEVERALHLRGDVAFAQTFVSPPAPINAGLGPIFNNNGCQKCHVRDGRGLAATSSGSHGSTLLVRVSMPAEAETQPHGTRALEALGRQLQDHAIFGAEAEARVEVEYIEQPGAYADGEPFSLRRPVLRIALRDGEPLPGDVLTSARIPPPVFGLGLLEAVPQDDIVALADPEDADADGISGRPNYVWDEVHGETALGRFGWKANVPGLLQQAAEAYAQDMGVSSWLFPEADGSTELDRATLEAVAFYTRTLAVPARDTRDDANLRRGEQLFHTLGCGACHSEQLHTREHEIAALRDQTFKPYTDLLLHNMGFDLADGRPDFSASGTEWRTAPLWGIGLAQTVLPYSTFLHDGRARDLAEAILWHAGEAEQAKERFRTSRAADRRALLAFLGAL